MPTTPESAGPFTETSPRMDACRAVYAEIVEQLGYSQPDADVLNALARLVSALDL